MEQQFLFDIVNALSSGLEQLYQKERLARMNRILKDAYNHDPMTNLFNRLGYIEYAEREMEDFHDHDERMLVVYIDMDNLKVINDSLGHDMGDIAIRSIADEMKFFTSRGGMCFRLGGDEFLVLDKYESDEAVSRTMEHIRKNLRDVSVIKGFPFELSISYGYTVTDPLSETSLEIYVNKADDLMYEDKKKRKKIRN